MSVSGCRSVDRMRLQWAAMRTWSSSPSESSYLYLFVSPTLGSFRPVYHTATLSPCAPPHRRSFLPPTCHRPSPPADVTLPPAYVPQRLYVQEHTADGHLRARPLLFSVIHLHPSAFTTAQPPLRRSPVYLPIHKNPSPSLNLAVKATTCEHGDGRLGTKGTVAFSIQPSVPDYVLLLFLFAMFYSRNRCHTRSHHHISYARLPTGRAASTLQARPSNPRTRHTVHPHCKGRYLGSTLNTRKQCVLCNKQTLALYTGIYTFCLIFLWKDLIVLFI